MRVSQRDKFISGVPFKWHGELYRYVPPHSLLSCKLAVGGHVVEIDKYGKEEYCASVEINMLGVKVYTVFFHKQVREVLAYNRMEFQEGGYDEI